MARRTTRRKTYGRKKTGTTSSYKRRNTRSRSSNRRRAAPRDRTLRIVVEQTAPSNAGAVTEQSLIQQALGGMKAPKRSRF